MNGLGKLGHDVSYIGWQSFGQPQGPPVHFHNKVLQFEGLPNSGGSQFGERAAQYWLAKKEPDVLVALGDFWMLSWLWKSEYVQPTALWFPIDGVPITDDIKRMLQRIDIPIAFSKFGHQLVTEAGVSSFYIPHGIDTNTYKPISQEEKLKAKIEFKLPTDKYVIGRVDRNQTRKMFPQTLKAFKIFHEWYPETILYLHADKKDREGWDLPYLCKRLGLVEGKDVFFPPPEKLRDFMLGVSDEEMNRVYNMIDIHLPLTGGEGFGLSLAHSAATGCVNVATDYTTSKELIGDCGKLVKVEYWEVCGAGVDRAFADPKDAAEKMKELYENPDLYAKLSQRAVEKMRQEYDLDRIVVPAFDEVLRKNVMEFKK